MDQHPVDDHLGARLDDRDGVEVGKPAAEASRDVLAPMGLDRATGQQGAQPHGLGQRRGQLLRVAPGDGRRQGGRDGMVLHRASLNWPAGRPAAGGRVCPGTR